MQIRNCNELTTLGGGGWGNAPVIISNLSCLSMIIYISNKFCIFELTRVGLWGVDYLLPYYSMEGICTDDRSGIIA